MFKVLACMIDYFVLTTFTANMQTVQVSTFKARCLGLFKEVRDSREPIAVTLHGKTLAVVQPAPRQPASRVGKWLEENRHLLSVEEELELPPREIRADPFDDEHAD